MKSEEIACRTDSGAGVPEPLRDFRVSDADWIQAFYPWLDRHAHWRLELRLADEASTPPGLVQCDVGEIATRLQTHRDQLRRDRHAAELFWRLQPLVAGLDSSAVAAFVAFSCGLDCNDWAAWPVTERPRVMWEALHRCPLPPSVINWTGHGFDAWWLLQEPVVDTRRCKELQRAITHFLRATDGENAGMFHWPQTINGQLSEARLVRVVWWQPERRYSIDHLLECFTQAKGKCSVQWVRFLRLLPSPARMMWSSFSQDVWASQSAEVLNLALASTLILHDGERLDFETLFGMAPWNAGCHPTTAEMDLLWNTARGTPRSSLASRAVAPAPPAGPHPPAQPTLPGLLLDRLPASAWTEWGLLYRAAVGDCTEAPDEFHYLAILTVLGTTFGRNVVVHSGRPVFLNMYTVLVGPTGDRKSTAAQLALELVPQFTSRALMLNGVGSQEGLMERMASQQGGNPTLWSVDEMASLLRKARRESSGGLLEFITELFHCPDFMTHSTRSRAIHLQSPTLNILAGSTPTWLEAALQQDDILGGFANRFIYVTAQPKPDNPLPSRPDMKALKQLITWVRRSATGPVRELDRTADAEALWREFYVEWRRSLDDQSEQLAALLRRIDIYILKFAALSAAMDGAPKITQGHLSQAIDLGRFLAGCAHRLLGEIGSSTDCKLETLIERRLRDAHGQMRRKQLRQTLGGRVTGEKLDRILLAMERNGLIRQIDDQTARGASKLVQLT